MKCKAMVREITFPDGGKDYISERKAKYVTLQIGAIISDNIQACTGNITSNGTFEDGRYEIWFHCDICFEHVNLKELDFDRTSTHQPIDAALDILE